jgi:hypothetical protein
MLLRFLKDQTGDSVITMAISLGTVACAVWLILLLTEVDLKPGVAAFSEMSGPIRQRIAEFIGQS